MHWKHTQPGDTERTFPDGSFQVDPLLGNLNPQPHGCATKSFPVVNYVNPVNNTLAVNAAVENKDGKPVHPPWLITMELLTGC